MNSFLEIPERLTPQLTTQIKQLDDLVSQVNTLKDISVPLRIRPAFEYMQALVQEDKECSLDSILKFHKLIGE